jgi:hypothetical protein
LCVSRRLPARSPARQGTHQRADGPRSKQPAPAWGSRCRFLWMARDYCGTAPVGALHSSRGVDSRAVHLGGRIGGRREQRPGARPGSSPVRRARKRSSRCARRQPCAPQARRTEPARAAAARVASALNRRRDDAPRSRRAAVTVASCRRWAGPWGATWRRDLLPQCARDSEAPAAATGVTMRRAGASRTLTRHARAACCRRLLSGPDCLPAKGRLPPRADATMRNR